MTKIFTHMALIAGLALATLGTAAASAQTRGTVKATLTALALAASLFAGTARAQEAQDMGMMIEMSLTMLELSAERALRETGYGDVDVMGLTLTQLVEIKSVMSGSDYSPDDRKRQIGVILGK